MVYKLSIPAEKDVEKILQYTIETWGERQLESYYSLIEAALNEIGRKPDCPLCRSREELFPGCFSRPCGMHVIFYRKQIDFVEVVRILHQSMDYLRHLQEY